MQNVADIVKNNCLFAEDYTTSKPFIYSEVIEQCYKNINTFGVPYVEENQSTTYGSHKIFVYENNRKIDIKILKKIIEEDINNTLGIHFPNAYFVVSIIEPGYTKTNENSNLLKKRENYLLDIGIYQKVYENIKNYSLQTK